MRNNIEPRLSSGSRRNAGVFAVGLLLVGFLATTVIAPPFTPPAAAATSTPIRSLPVSALYPGGLWVNPKSQPAGVVAALTASGDTADAAVINQIASQPSALWLSQSWGLTLLQSKIAAALSAAEAVHRTPVFVAYAIPDRDCGGYSAGGYSTPQYIRWSAVVASALHGHTSVLLVEPDSIAMLADTGCSAVATTRLSLIATVVKNYAAQGVAVYLDGGNSHWIAPSVMAARLKTAGIQYARGFFTNVANFTATSREISYADSLSSLLGGAHYVVDVSRNGTGWSGQWCNPTGAALGQSPAVSDGTTALDALLWVKTAGSSDGTCNGGPPAGQWFESYAEALVTNRTH